MLPRLTSEGTEKNELITQPWSSAICITGFVKVVPVQSENFDDDLTVALTTTPDNPRVTGYAEPFQERSLDLLARPYNYFGKVTEDELLEILGKHNMLTDRL